MFDLFPDIGLTSDRSEVQTVSPGTGQVQSVASTGTAASAMVVSSKVSIWWTPGILVNLPLRWLFL